MDAAIIVALIALAGSIFGTGLSLYGQRHAVQAEEARDAEKVLAKYREPLILGAYELQSRLYNIVRKDFLAKYYVRDAEGSREYAREHTLYLLGQYFSWTEIMRRENQFLQFAEADETRSVARAQQRVRRLFASDEEQLGAPLMIWRGEQSAIGEQMTDVEDGERVCIGYATFVARRGDREFSRWFERLAADIDLIAPGPNPRVRELQHALVDLVLLLDANGVRFPEEIQKA